MEKSRKAIIFGCGGVGKEVKRKLELNGIEVIAFSDNDEKKWKDTFEDRIVICPEDIRLYSFDVVAIGLYKAVKEVKIQLLNLGIAEDCIIIPIEPVHIFKNPLPVMGKIEELKRADYESETTKAYLQKKVVIDDKEFLSKLDDLKKTLKSNNIPREKVCIVSGAVLQAYGLRKSKKFDDIDVIMTNDLRQIYGTGLVILSSTAEMHPQNKYRITDDEIIQNEKYHFIFEGLKFACPEVMDNLFGGRENKENYSI